jgi:HlyD family secretion protein
MTDRFSAMGPASKQAVARAAAAAWPRQRRRPRHDVRGSIRRHIIFGAASVMLLAGGLGVWAGGSELSGAVVAAGHLVVESHVKAVQHPAGGVVGELNVKNGDEVEAGDVLLKLDDTQTRANLAIVTNGLDVLAARRARLVAERDGLAAIGFPSDLAARADEAPTAELLDGETRLFALRSAAREGQRGQLKKRVGQFEEEIAGLESQRAAKDREIALIREELGSVRQLWDKKLVQRSRLLELERFETRLTGERGELVAATGQARGRITEAELAIIQIDHDLRSEVARELRDAEAQAAELEERRVAAEQQLRQTLVRAPQGGRVHELAVHTIGGVVAAGEPIMRIVPSGDELTVEARVAPQDIDQVRAGQPAFLRLSAFNQQTTPELEGRVLAVSPDLVTDRASGASFFVVQIGIDDREAASGLEQGLTPGMPVEVFLRTSDRTVLSYLLKPVSDQVSRAFRE